MRKGGERVGVLERSHRCEGGATQPAGGGGSGQLGHGGGCCLPAPLEWELCAGRGVRLSLRRLRS